jgi:site-specific recombinase XerD
MVNQQLSIFKRKTFPAQVQKSLIAVGQPTGERSVMSTLPTYSAHLHSKGYAASTIEKYYGDLKKFSVFMSGKKIEEITRHDVAQWIETLVSKRGAHLDRKTINRKVSAYHSHK